MPRLLLTALFGVGLFLSIYSAPGLAADGITPDLTIDQEETGQLSPNAQAEILKRCQDANYSQVACDAVMAKISNKTEKWLSIGKLKRDPDYGLDSEYNLLPKLNYNAVTTPYADTLSNKKPERNQFIFQAEPMVDKGFWQIGAPYKFMLENPNATQSNNLTGKDIHRFRIGLACRANGVPIYDEVKECRLIMRQQISPLTTEMLHAAEHQMDNNAIDDAATVWHAMRIIRFPNGLGPQQVLADQCHYTDSDLGKTNQDRLIALLPEWRPSDPGAVKPVYAWRIDYAGNIFPIQNTGLQCTRCWSCELRKQLSYFLNPYTEAAKLQEP